MEQLSRTCKACGKERKKKGLIMYTSDTLTPYCNNPYICNEQHPNSPANIISRQATVELIPFEDAEHIYKETLKDKYADKSIYQMVAKIMATPSTVRINEPDMAEFLVGVMMNYNLDSKSDAIRFCVQEAMLNHKEFDLKTKQLEHAIVRGETMKETLQSLEEEKQDQLEEKVAPLVQEVETFKKLQQEQEQKEKLEKINTLVSTQKVAEDLEAEEFDF